jgi:anti-anti-sigma factor
MHADFTLSPLYPKGPVALFHVGGRLDAVAAQELRKRCLEARQLGHKHVALDLSAVSFVASSGVGTLLALTEEFGKDGALYLAPISLPVRSVIQLLNLEPYLAIYESLEEAIAVLR